MAAVRRPVELLDSSERFSGQFEQVVGPQDVERVVRCDGTVHESCDIAAGDFGHPMVPVAVHQVLCCIGLGLVKRRVGICRLHHGGILDGGSVYYLLAVRRDFEFPDAGGYIAEFHLLSELACLEGCLKKLASLEEVDILSVLAPAGAGYALLFVGEPDFARTVRIAGVNVPQGVVLFDVLVAYSIEDFAPVGRKLRVGQASECKEYLRSHDSVVYLYFRNGRLFRRVSGAGCCNHHCKD